jgi:hypothetical protein
MVQAAKEAAPVLEEAVVVAAALEAPSEFERFVQTRNDALRAVACDEDALRTAGIEWLATKIPSTPTAPPADRAATAFERYTHEMKEAVRDNGGQPRTGNGTSSFWQRSVAALREASERLAGWIKDIAQDFVGRLRQDRDTERDEPGLER